MSNKHCLNISIYIVFGLFIFQDALGNLLGMADLQYWRCTLKRSYVCPNNNINFFLYTRNTGYNARKINVRDSKSLVKNGWDINKKNVLIVHGFNGSESKSPVTILKRAYILRDDYNIFTADWEVLSRFPCYLSALSNMRLVGKCGAQLYSHMTKSGASANKITCVGHSLGAHICGMISRFLDIPQHRIIGLDPAKPLVREYGSKFFRLTRDDATVVQIIHTNAGLLGDVNQIGHADFCVNGGFLQPRCKGHRLYRMRCSHVLSVCYFARTLNSSNVITGKPCRAKCPSNVNANQLPGIPVPMGEHTPDNARGMFCVQLTHDLDCPFH